MARHPEPWFWKARRGWYATVDGRRHRLASKAEGKAAAAAKLAGLLQARGEGPEAGVPTVGHLIASYIEQLDRRATAEDVARSSYRDAVRRLADFPDALGSARSDSVRPDDVLRWLDTHPGWGPTTRHDAIGAVKAAFRWAVRAGQIDRDPLAGLDKPRRRARREEIPTPEAIEKAFDAAVEPRLVDLLTFLFETGCRPKEARVLEASHLDPAEGVAILAEHKTSRKTGKSRVVYLSARAAEIAGRLAAEYPEGPIFRNARGRPWTHGALGQAVRRLRKRAGLGREVIAYALRHHYATDALAKQVPVALVAELMGHADLRMMATYSHLGERHDVLRDAACKVRGEGGQ